MNTLIIILEISYAVIFAIVAYIIIKKILSTAKNNNIGHKTAIYSAIAILFWYSLSLILAFKGFFHSPAQFSKGDVVGLLEIVVLMFIPLITFFYILKQNNAFKKLAYSIDLKFLTTIQFYRIMGGVYFFSLLLSNKAPKLFTIPTGFFDGFIGISALFLGYMLIKKKSSIILFKIWNYIGLFDFLLAFTIYFLYFPFFILKASPEMLMWAGFYPMSFIVIFIVPLSMILHFLAIKKLKYCIL